MKPQSVVVIAKRWFDRKNGNTYFSAVGIVDGETKARIEFDYGYGDAYLWSVFSELNRLGITDSGNTPPSLYCRENGINLVIHVSEVSRKRDL